MLRHGDTIFKDFDPGERLYCSIAAAVLGAGVVGAAATGYAANKAADAQKEMGYAAIDNTRDMWNQNKNLLMPFITGGTDALGKLTDWTDPTSGSNPLASLIKLTTPGADMNEVLAQTPGYQFSQKQGQRAVQNALAARGLGGSAGAVAKGVADYTQGLAGNTWNSVVQNLLQTFGTGTNALQGIVSTGANAGSSLASQGTAASSQINNALTGIGNASAAGTNAIGSAVAGAANTVPTAMLMQQLMGQGGAGSGTSYNNPGAGIGSPMNLNGWW